MSMKESLQRPSSSKPSMFSGPFGMMRSIKTRRPPWFLQSWSSRAVWVVCSIPIQVVDFLLTLFLGLLGFLTSFFPLSFGFNFYFLCSWDLMYGLVLVFLLSLLYWIGWRLLGRSSYFSAFGLVSFFFSVFFVFLCFGGILVLFSSSLNTIFT